MKRPAGSSAALATMCVLLSGCDAVNVSNGTANENGLMVDGQNGAAFTNDRNFTGVATSFNVGTLTAAAENNEVAAFTNGRPPKIINTPWTSATDSFDANFRPTIAIPVTVWIVRGPFNDQRQHAIEACIRTSAIWQNERMGVIFSPFEIRDATADPQAASHFAFPNGDVGDSVWAPLRTDIGFVAGRLNIYWVDTVNGGTGSGWSNFGNQVAMGRNSGDELLSHEIGHAFSLTHVDASANFNTENIMHSASNTRQFATEGQLFRAHLNPTSILNATYNARAGEPQRTCGFGAATALCPVIQKRLWADGAFAAN